MTGKPRPQYSALQLLGESGACVTMKMTHLPCMTIKGVSSLDSQCCSNTCAPHVGNGQKHVPSSQVCQQNDHCKIIDSVGQCLQGRA